LSRPHGARRVLDWCSPYLPLSFLAGKVPSWLYAKEKRE
jgi:hypothetical protein